MDNHLRNAPPVAPEQDLPPVNTNWDEDVGEDAATMEEYFRRLEDEESSSDEEQDPEDDESPLNASSSLPNLLSPSVASASPLSLVQRTSSSFSQSSFHSSQRSSNAPLLSQEQEIMSHASSPRIVTPLSTIPRPARAMRASTRNSSTQPEPFIGTRRGRSFLVQGDDSFEDEEEASQPERPQRRRRSSRQ